MQNRRAFIKSTVGLGAGVMLSPFSKVETRAQLLSDIPIVDTHFHMWELDRFDYAWLEENSSELSHDFTLADYQKETKQFRVQKMVFVECGRDADQYLEEVKWVIDQSKTDFRIQGIVAYFPIEKGKQSESLLEELAHQPLVKGIRRMGSPSMISESKDFLEGLQMLPQYQLSFDLHIGSKDISSILPVLDQCPNTMFIINHMALPDIKSGVWESWKKGIEDLARRPNVYCKISGIVTRADPTHWTAEDLKPYVFHVLECFTVERVMYGSDWPVLSRASDFEEWTSTLERMLKDISRKELEKFFCSNAERIYRL